MLILTHLFPFSSWEWAAYRELQVFSAPMLGLMSWEGGGEWWEVFTQIGILCDRLGMCV